MRLLWACGWAFMWCDRGVGRGRGLTRRRREYPIARAFVDSRVQPIYGGADEIMKELIARSI